MVSEVTRLPRFAALAAGTLMMSLAAAVPRQAAPPIEAYAALPEVSLVTISPSGTRLALRRSAGEDDLVAIVDLETGSMLGGVDVSDVDPQSLRFADDDRLVLVVGEYIKSGAIRDAFEASAAFLLETGDSRPRELLRRARQLYPAQSGLGRIIDQSEEHAKIYMPAFVQRGERTGITYGIFEVSTDSNRVRLLSVGTPHTIDWFLDEDSRPIVREDLNSDDGLHQIWVADGEDWRLLYEYETDLPVIVPIGWMPARDALVIKMVAHDSDRVSFATLSLENGSIGDPIFARDDADVASVLADKRRVVHGAVYSGFKPRYEFFDDDIQRRFDALRNALPETAVRLVDWSDGFETAVVQISGGWNAGGYFLFSAENPDPALIAWERLSIPSEAIAPTTIESYEARDGLTIPALVTATADLRQAGGAPLVVLPHGGPESHDRFEFDWLAQFIASRGYVVLQPQFRGSTGFGLAHRQAGYGEWGRSMQHDLDDGVAWLTERGLVDPDQVCIVGWSYGGYAALAAGAFSPERYRCVASINGVSDLESMLTDERRRFGRGHWLLTYWERQYGGGLDERDLLKERSPAEHAAAFDAPVLLVHGAEDTVVPYSQSRTMQKALRRADKDVTLIRIRGDDHSLDDSESRLALLEALEAFLAEHL